jgi:uncharacterized protein (UPF0332 family)
MSWRKLKASRRVQEHETSPQELDDLRAIVDRDLRDAALPGLSADRRFATAYNAVLTIAKMVVAAAGYRVVGQGHHRTAFEALEQAMGHKISDWIDYFDAARRKRNIVDYDLSAVASEEEAQELIQKAKEFRAIAENWIAEHHSRLKTITPRA